MLKDTKGWKSHNKHISLIRNGSPDLLIIYRKIEFTSMRDSQNKSDYCMSENYGKTMAAPIATSWK